MRLAKFIRAEIELILQEWEEFAKTIHLARRMDKTELRDHARGMLLEIADDLDSHQSEAEQAAKSKGFEPREGKEDTREFIIPFEPETHHETFADQDVVYLRILDDVAESQVEPGYGKTSSNTAHRAAISMASSVTTGMTRPILKASDRCYTKSSFNMPYECEHWHDAGRAITLSYCMPLY